jgi:hypothetical protein
MGFENNQTQGDAFTNVCLYYHKVPICQTHSMDFVKKLDFP